MDQDMPNSQGDSVLVWIHNAQNVDISINKRIKAINKAKVYTQTMPDDSIKLKNLSRIQWTYMDLKDSLAFRQTNKETRSLALQLQDSARLANTHWDLAFYLSKNAVASKDSAYYHYSLAQQIFTDQQNKRKAAFMLYDMASIQVELKDFTGAEINLVKAIARFKTLDENLNLFECYNLMGIISKDLKDYPKALENYGMAEQYLSKIEEKGALQETLDNNVGMVYQDMKQHQKAIVYFKKVLANTKLVHQNPELYARALNNLGYSEMKAGDLADLENKFRRSLAIRDSIKDGTGIAASHYNLAEYYLLQKDSTKALVEANQARRTAEQSISNDRILQSLGLLARVDPENAVNYSQAYIRLSDSLVLSERRERDKFARIRFETNETLEQNRLLAKQKQLWAGIALTLMLLALAAYIIIVQRIKNQRLRFQREQQASDKKIFNLLLSEGQKLEEGKKMEQKRISEELHDGVQGRLQGVRMVLLGLNKRTTPEAIAERADAIKELMAIQEEVRSISHELSNAAYQNLPNFINSIKELLNKLEVSAQLEHSFEYDHKTDWDALSGDIKIHLYRVLQESLQNCVKHAKAQNVSLRFDVDAGNVLKITLADDGIGFEVSRGKKGIGLRNIASRVRKMGGVWNIESSIGQGTVVNITIPIQLFDEEASINIKQTLQDA